MIRQLVPVLLVMIVSFLPGRSGATESCALLAGSSGNALSKIVPRDNTPTKEALLVREFALHAYRRIAIDILNRRGPYLDTLHEMFLPACRSKSQTTQWLNAQLRESKDAVEFSGRLMAVIQTTANVVGNAHATDR